MTMVDSNINPRKRRITEGDTATLLKRYDMKTILKLLQEMAYYSDVKMDWNELVKKTTTGITNAREYQMLWRHLSYREPLLPVGDGVQPLDDDSDMECEVEASPAPSLEASVEAIAHVKVMAASYVPSESDILDDSTVEAPMTLNIPYLPPEGNEEPSDSPWSSRGMNITFPICLQKATTSVEGLNGYGSASSASRKKKRQKWSPEEDEELFAAVRRCGEGNWAHIVKGDFKGERTASQLSQRWALIRKKCDTSTSASQSGLQQTEAQIAVNHALSVAVGNRHPSKKLAVGVLPTTASCSITEAQAYGSSSSQGQGQQQSKPRAATSVSASKSRVAVKKTTGSSGSKSHLMETANSVAAAACMGGILTAAAAPKANPGKAAAPLVPKIEPVRNASTVCMRPPSGSLSVPKVEPGKTVAASSIISSTGPANSRPLATGNLKLGTASTGPTNTRPLATGNLKLGTASTGPANIQPPATGNLKLGTAASTGPANTRPPATGNLKLGTAASTGPANTRPLATGNLKPGTATPSSKPPLSAPRVERSPMLSASSTVSNQRALAASVPATVLPPEPTAGPVTCKPNSGQREEAQGDEASALVSIQPNKMSSTNSEISRTKQAQIPNLLPSESLAVETGPAQSSNLLPRKLPVVETAVHGATNQNLVDKPSSKTAVPSISGPDLQSKSKCEVNNKVGAAIKVSNACGKPPEVATVAGTGQGV